MIGHCMQMDTSNGVLAYERTGIPALLVDDIFEDLLEPGCATSI
jgi:hypothetical protein